MEMLIDSHCHLDVADFAADRAEVLARTRAAGVTAMVVPGVAAAGWPSLLALCRGEAGLYPALGLHPLYVEQHREADIDQLRALVVQERPVAIGEIGLDFYPPEVDRERQQHFFEAQLQIAAEHRLPVLLHVRKAHDAVLTTLKRYPLCGGIAHAFNGSLQQAEQYRALGFKFGFGGMLTYERSNRLRQLAATLPLEDLVLETDAPDMSPAQHHGERNAPEYLPQVLDALAAIRSESREAIAEQTTENVRRLLSI